MFIALYHIIKNWALPSIAVATTGLASTVAVIIIMIIGIRMVLSLFNVTTSGRTSGILVKAAIDAIGYTCKKVVEAIGWVIRKVVAVTPKIYVSSKRFFNKRGLNDTISSLLAGVIAILFIIIII